MQLQVEINRQPTTLEAEPGEDLLRVLRRHGFWSVKYGCDTGECGACLVLVDGQPQLACLVRAARVESRRLTTVEALGHRDALHPLQSAFLEGGAVQCGYCTPAMLLAAHALLERQPTPDEADVREALANVLCRCTGYVKPVEAVLAAAPRVRERAEDDEPDDGAPRSPEP